jgi:hypothetical protein
VAIGIEWEESNGGSWVSGSIDGSGGGSVGVGKLMDIQWDWLV